MAKPWRLPRSYELNSFALLPDGALPEPPFLFPASIRHSSTPIKGKNRMACRLKAERIERYFHLRNSRLEQQRHIDAIKREEDQIAKELEAYLEEKGVSEATVCNKRYRLGFSDGAAIVSWKDEFIRVKSAEDAERILTEAPKRRKLTVVDLSPAGAASAA